MKFVITDLSIETLPEPPMGQGEGEFVPAGSESHAGQPQRRAFARAAGARA